MYYTIPFIYSVGVCVCLCVCVCVGLVLGPLTAFSSLHEKSGRAWYQKSHDLHHDRVMLHSQKVGLKLELYTRHLFYASLESTMIALRH